MDRLIERAATLMEALPYIRAFRGKIVVVKYGGASMDDPSLHASFAGDVTLLAMVGIRPVIVHGGGPQISAAMNSAGIEPKFVNGLRVSGPDAVAVVQRVLAGDINPHIVGLLNGHGCPAVGLTGQMHGLVLLDAKDEVLRPAILWNDQRTAAECAEIETRVGRAALVREVGNVALTGEIDLQACGGRFVLALGFGQTATEAALRVRASLSQGIDDALAEYVSSWRSWQDSLMPLDADNPPERANTYRVSTAVLRTHEARSFAGGYIASLSIPWGFSKGDEDLGGYHLVWPRDLVETAGGLLAAGATAEARARMNAIRSGPRPSGLGPATRVDLTRLVAAPPAAAGGLRGRLYAAGGFALGARATGRRAVRPGTRT